MSERADIARERTPTRPAQGGAPTPPAHRVPSPYARPSTAPVIARRVATDDGARIATFVYGRLAPATSSRDTREPVLFLHGNGEEHGIFGPLVDAVVSAGHAAVCLDSRAQGRSTRGRARLSYELMALDALVCLDALGVRRAHLVGFSDGAIEALLIARDHPERALSLLAIGANLTPEGVVEEDGWDLAGSARAARSWAAWAQGLPADGDVDPTLLCPTAGEARDGADLLELMLEEPHVKASSLAAVRCPATIVAGEHDCVRPEETQAIYKGICSGGNERVRLVVVSDCAHNVPKQAPQIAATLALETIRAAAPTPRS